MVVQPEKGASRANSRFEPAGVRRLVVHQEPRDLVGAATPVSTVTEVADGRLGAPDDRRTGANQQGGDNGIA